MLACSVWNAIRVAVVGGPATELATAATMHAAGQITDDDDQTLTARILA